jgi:curved DNA-binding protein CbpA
MATLRTHYDNLKVARTACQAEIRKAYRKLASIHHPDRNGNSPASVKAMSCINSAYEVLSCPQKRHQHDSWIASQENLRAPAGHSSSSRQYFDESPGSWSTQRSRDPFSHYTEAPELRYGDDRSREKRQFTAFREFSEVLITNRNLNYKFDHNPKYSVEDLYSLYMKYGEPTVSAFEEFMRHSTKYYVHKKSHFHKGKSKPTEVEQALGRIGAALDKALEWAPAPVRNFLEPSNWRAWGLIALGLVLLSAL